MSRITRLFATALLLAGALVVANTERAWADVCKGLICHVDPTADGYRYVYQSGFFYKLPNSVVQAGPNGTPQEYFYQPACPSNGFVNANGQGNDALCVGATTTCPPGEIRMWVFVRDVGSYVPPQRLPDSVCIGGTAVLPLGDVKAAILRELRENHVPLPTLTVEPPDRAVVNAPVIVHSQPVQPQGFAVTLPLPAQVNATPSWRWDFGDGTVLADAGPGRPYDGTSPTGNPSYYVDHAYVAPGTATVTVIVHWTGEFTVAGIAEPFPLDPLELSFSVSFPMQEAHSVLVS